MAMNKTDMKTSIRNAMLALAEEDKRDPDKAMEAFCDGLISYMTAHMQVTIPSILFNLTPVPTPPIVTPNDGGLTLWGSTIITRLADKNLTVK